MLSSSHLRFLTSLSSLPPHLIFFIGLFFFLFILLSWHRIQHRFIARPGSSVSALPQSCTKSSQRTAPSSFITTFPPSNRAGLHRLVEAGKASPSVTQFPRDLAKSGSWLETCSKRIVWTADYRELPDETVILSGFTLAEVRALGKFPDYGVLSGAREGERVQEYLGFELAKARHRPYRPFRWNYHQTMALHRLDHSFWLEVTATYAATIHQRQCLLHRHRKLILSALPGSELACQESMEIALQFYCQRHPRFFSLSHDAGKGWIFHNTILNKHTVLMEHHPLDVLGMHVPEDFALMLRSDEDGKYYLRAGIICSAIGWNLGEKLGKELKEIHGAVPDYQAKMEFSMDRFFANLPVSRPIQRAAWGFEIGQPLFVPPNDPTDAWRAVQRPDLGPEDVSLRVDWQTLRRLPLSAGILFNYKAIFTPLEEMRTEPGVPALVAKVLTEGHEGIRKYKNTWHTEHVVVPAMQQWAAEQVQAGLVRADWEVETLAESPFYPGWKEKWQERQGF